MMPAFKYNPKCLVALLWIVVLLFTGGDASLAQTQHRIGAGGHYWTVVDDIDDEGLDDNGVGAVISYQLIPRSLLKFEADLEVLPEDYAGSEDLVLSPQLFFAVGSILYAGVGAGIHYSDGEFADSPFFILRAGFDFEILPTLFLDLNANYRFADWPLNDEFENIDADTITLGTTLRIEF